MRLNFLAVLCFTGLSLQAVTLYPVLSGSARDMVSVVQVQQSPAISLNVFTGVQILTSLVDVPALWLTPYSIAFRSVQLNTPVRLTLNSMDMQRWLMVRSLTEETEVYSGNWLGFELSDLRSKIKREGFSDAVMADFERIKAQIAAPMPKPITQ